ncbi:MAG: ribonuclease P protein component [Thermomicrobiales bacterium]|nr:ribonuclease P protein component [Thermomicrobiales bacterium]
MERSSRLRESFDIRRVRGRGRAYPEGPLVVRVLPNQLQPPRNRYTVIAGKKQGGSVQRNRVKRLCREALRHLHPALVEGVDLAVIVRGQAEEIPNYAAARALLDRVVARAGLLRPGAISAGPPIPESRP